jgi:four helix bundle protein
MILKINNFQKLDVWGRLIDLAKTIYKMTEKFPADEKFGLYSQQRRAVISAISNLAEGSSRFSPKEKCRFFEMAYGSCIELKAQILISLELGFINETDSSLVLQDVDKVVRMLSGLYRAQSSKS